MKGRTFGFASLSLPVARSANRGRASASPQIWRPSPIFALRYACRGSIEISHPLDLGYHHQPSPPNHPFRGTWNQESTRKNYNSETSLKAIGGRVLPFGSK